MLSFRQFHDINVQVTMDLDHLIHIDEVESLDALLHELDAPPVHPPQLPKKNTKKS
jgi:hypothetical protein